MSLGTNHDYVEDKVLVARLNALGAGRRLSTVHSALAARIVSVQLCFFANSLELFLKIG